MMQYYVISFCVHKSFGDNLNDISDWLMLIYMLIIVLNSFNLRLKGMK